MSVFHSDVLGWSVNLCYVTDIFFGPKSLVPVAAENHPDADSFFFTVHLVQGGSRMFSIFNYKELGIPPEVFRAECNRLVAAFSGVSGCMPVSKATRNEWVDYS